MRIVGPTLSAQHRASVVLSPHEIQTREVIQSLLGLGLTRAEVLTQAAQRLNVSKIGLKSRLARMQDKGVRL